MSRIDLPFLLLLMAMTPIASAQSTQPATAKPDIAIQTITEEGKKLIRATVTLNGKPVEGARVEFFVKRSFGDLLLGHDETLDDGTAAAAFPEDLPGDSQGQLQLVATISNPTRYSEARTQVKLSGASVVPLTSEPFPRALWAPHAPMALILTILAILAIVWCSYAYVLAQLLAIARRR